MSQGNVQAKNDAVMLVREIWLFHPGARLHWNSRAKNKKAYNKLTRVAIYLCEEYLRSVGKL